MQTLHDSEGVTTIFIIDGQLINQPRINYLKLGTGW